MQAFVGQLRRDILAVDAAVTTPWSNGQVEGQVSDCLHFVDRSPVGDFNSVLSHPR
jgi:hypothetical protein